MKIIISLFLLVELVRADIYGVAEALVLGAATTATIQMSLESLKDYDDELEKTVKTKRQILKNELIRDMYLSKKIHYINKIKQSLSRVSDADSLILQSELLNNKIWTYNTSMK